MCLKLLNQNVISYKTYFILPEQLHKIQIEDYICIYKTIIMPRTKRERTIGFLPGVTFYKPAGVPLKKIEDVNLELDELEAMRLSDYQGLYQEDASVKMNVSRPTFGRILESAHKKIAQAIIEGKAIRINGGNVDFVCEKEAKESL